MNATSRPDHWRAGRPSRQGFRTEDEGLSTRTQAPSATAAQAGEVLWSDPRDEPSPEARRAQRMLRRAGLLLAVLGFVAAVLLVR